MSQSYKPTFIITIGLIFLLPLIFVPAGVLPLSYAKTLVLVLGILAGALLFLYQCWREGVVSFPKHYILYFVALLPAIYLLSALLTTPSSLSLLGYNFEVGTFGFILLGSSLFVLATATVSNGGKALRALTAFFGALTLLALFVWVKILSDRDILVLGNFAGNMGNPLGGWTDMGVVFGLLSILSILAIGMLPMKPLIKWLLHAIFVLSTALLLLINFSIALALTLGASVLVWLYFSQIERQFAPSSGGGRKRFVLLPIILAIVSLLFLVNPTVSGEKGKLSNVMAGISGVNNSDVRPTFSATLTISKAVLSQVALLGSGPNTFSQDWLIFKPKNVNATPFWSIAFPSGVGFVPTQIATTGILGTLVWALFLLSIIVLALKSLNHIPESRALRFTLISSLFITVFIWAASIVYTPSLVVLILGFVFAGIFVALVAENGIIPKSAINLRGSTSARLASIIVVGLLTVGALYLGVVTSKRIVAAYHFQKAVKLANTAGTPLTEVEDRLMKAIKIIPLDIYYGAASQLYFAKAKSAANATEETTENNQALFQDSLSKSIATARSAVTVNPTAYQNWEILGSIYGALVPEPLSVEGAYENAQFAYAEAYKRNPNDPRLPLLLAQLEFSKKNVNQARSYIQNAITLKPDYADAYLMLAQLEVSENNLPGAIASTEALAQLAPSNAGIFFELGVLKYSNQNYSSAAESLEKSLELVPDYANAKYYLALALQRLGRTDEARIHLGQLLVANPDNQELKAAIEALNTPAKR